MRLKNRQRITHGFINLLLLFAVMAPGTIFAEESSDVLVKYSGPEASIREFLCAPAEGADSYALNNCINRIYRFGIATGSLVLIFFVVVAGYIYITGGEKGKTKGKLILLNAGVGMGILLLSYTLLRFINPNLVIFKPIQPPIFNPLELATCQQLGFDENCSVGEGEDVAGDEGSLPTGGTEKDGVIYGGTTYNNFPRFAQYDPPWGPKSYGGKPSYTKGGCGPTAFAAIVKYFVDHKGATMPGGGTVDPEVIGNMAVQGGFRGPNTAGTVHGFVASIAPKIGLKAEMVSWDKAVSLLEKGTPIHTSSNWKGGGFRTDVRGGHFIVLIAKKGDMVYVADSWKTNITGVRVDKMKQFYNRGYAITSPTFTPPDPATITVTKSGGGSSKGGGSSAVAVDFSGKPSGAVDLSSIDSSIKINMKYATSDNFTGTVLYKENKCYLTKSVADKVKKAQAALKAKDKNKTLEVYDCYRPTAVQQLMVDWAQGKATWATKKAPANNNYVGTYIGTVGGGKHPRGIAIDLTISGANMPSAYDEFSSKAGGSNSDSALLKNIMSGAGLSPYSKEWWHFSE